MAKPAYLDYDEIGDRLQGILNALDDDWSDWGEITELVTKLREDVLNCRYRQRERNGQKKLPLTKD